MKNLLRTPIPVAVLLLCSCAASSLKMSWKSPLHTGGPVRKIAVVTVDQRGLVRQGFENRFVRQFKEQGQPAIVTFDLLTLPQIKDDKAAAAKRLQEAGADSVLVVRLLDVASYATQMRLTNERYVANNEFVSSYGWYDYFSTSFMDMSSVYGTLKQEVFLEINLFELDGTGKPVWSGITETVVKEGVDRVELIDPLIAKVLKAMRADGVVR
jgi:hypothetical protein